MALALVFRLPGSATNSVERLVVGFVVGYGFRGCSELTTTKLDGCKSVLWKSSAARRLCLVHIPVASPSIVHADPRRSTVCSETDLLIAGVSLAMHDICNLRAERTMTLANHDFHVSVEFVIFLKNARTCCTAGAVLSKTRWPL